MHLETTPISKVKPTFRGFYMITTKTTNHLLNKKAGT